VVVAPAVPLETGLDVFVAEAVPLAIEVGVVDPVADGVGDGV